VLTLTQLIGFAVGGLGQGENRIYTTGTAATETVPVGATSVRIRVYGGGAAGGRDNTDNVQQGGGGGGFCEKVIAVAGGNTFTFTVGALVAGRSTNGDGANGNLSSVSGTVAGGAVNMTANGGEGGRGFGGSKNGAGGTASGGDSNTNGGNGITPSGGSCLGPGGGAGGGLPNADGVAPGGAGAAAVSGMSGDGARGQIEFSYT